MYIWDNIVVKGKKSVKNHTGGNNCDMSGICRID